MGGRHQKPGEGPAWGTLPRPVLLRVHIYFY